MPEGVINSESYDLATLSRMWSTAGSFTATNPQKEYKHIKQYNYIPESFNFHKFNNEDELYLGVELEIDNGGTTDENAKLVIDLLGNKNTYCKHDGSLSNGFEIVTHPCTFDYHSNLPYDDLFKKLSTLGYRSHDVSTCGLHIHFNRNYFAKDKLTQDLNISKLLYLFEKFWNKIVIVARRDSNQYARRYYLNNDETPLDIYAKSKNSDKYGVINLQHKDTVEVRIFKGTLNYNTYISTLEFMDTIIKIVKDTDIYNIQYLTWEDISSQFSDNLNSYIAEREEIKKKEKQEEVSHMVRNSYNYPYMTHCDISRSDPFTFTWYNEPVSVSTIRTENQRVRYNRSEINDMDFQEMTIEHIEWKIKFIKEDMRRANNMEKQMLQRELAKYTNRLGEIRIRH